jgi:hypothetical protein
MSRAAGDTKSFANISASTANFVLNSGRYGLDVGATFGGGSVKLQKLLGDATNYVSVSTGTDFSAAGYATVDLPQGVYRLTVATASAVYAAGSLANDRHNDRD